jgi:hypothetical protein
MIGNVGSPGAGRARGRESPRPHVRAGRTAVRVLAVLLLAACGGAERDDGAPGRIDVLYVHSHSPVGTPAQWVARTQAEWDALRARVAPEAPGIRWEVRPDWARESLVVATAGAGSSGAPDVTFRGYRDEGRTRFVFVRYCMPASAAEDVTQAIVVASMPRWDGEVRLVQRRVARDTC